MQKSHNNNEKIMAYEVKVRAKWVFGGLLAFW